VKIFCSDMTIFDRAEGDSYHQLRRVFLRAAQGQHEILLTDVDHLLKSDFFTQATAPMDRMEWQELVRRTALATDVKDPTIDPVTPPKRLHAFLARKPVPIDSFRRFSLTPRDAGDWAEQSLEILLENDRDWRLLEAAARAMARPLVEDAYLRRWLTSRGCGGSEIVNRIKARGYNERLFVFIDSDKGGLQNEISTTAKNIEEKCGEEPSPKKLSTKKPSTKKPPIPCRITRKREVENYIPRTTLEATINAQPKRLRRLRQAGRKSLLEAFVEWSRLSDVDKDYDDLKARFGERLTEAALDNLKDPAMCPAGDLIALAGEELKEVLDLVEEHL